MFRNVDHSSLVLVKLYIAKQQTKKPRIVLMIYQYGSGNNIV